MTRDEKGMFCLQVDFAPGTADPSDVLRGLTQLIETLGQLDEALTQTTGTGIRPRLVLEDFEHGSLRTWLRTRLESVDDHDVRNLDWRRVVGMYLVRAKKALLALLSDQPTIATRQDVQSFRNAILRAAEESGVAALPTYSAIQTDRVIRALDHLGPALSGLGETETFTFISDDGGVIVPKARVMPPELVERLLTRDVIESSTEMILRVRKPDYLGATMWEFRHDSRHFSARIRDHEWLRLFQSRRLDVRPGDSLRAVVSIQVYYGFGSEIVAERHEVLKVLEVIPLDPDLQVNLLPPF